MASVSRHFCRSLLQLTRQVPAKRKYRQPLRLASAAPTRQFSITRTWLADESSSDSPSQSRRSTRAEKQEDTDDNALENLDPSEYLTPTNPFTVQDLDPEERADYEVLSKPEQERYLALENHAKALVENGEDDEALERMTDQLVYQMDREGGPLDLPTPRARGNEVGFWADDEEDEHGQMEDDDDEFSEEHITTVAESQLEVHREVREYTRLAAWDLPLLHKYAKPFELPDMSKTPLRFRYTTYMGEDHPAAKKVVVQFCTKDLQGLTEPQRIKLIKIVGVRYNPDTDIVKMSSEKFEEPAQNKRYLGDLVNKIITEAKDSTDMFEDIPLDFRHHKPKRRPVYPEEWKLRPERVQQLLEQRKQNQSLLEAGQQPVDGKEVVRSYVMSSSMKPYLTNAA